MSGPKVIRIVTREEIVAACEGELARLDAALEEWIRVGRRNDCVSDPEIEAARKNRADLAALLQQDRFLDLQKGAAREVQFLSADLQERLAKVAEQAAIARASARRQREAAAALLNALNSRGDVSEELRRRLESVVAGAPDPQAMADGFAQLSRENESAGSARRQELAAMYMTGEAGPSTQQWQHQTDPSPAEQRLLSIDRQLAQLQQADDSDATSLMERRADIESDADEQRRNIKIDSLELDLARTLAEARAGAAVERHLTLALAQLASLAPTEHSALAAKRRAVQGQHGLEKLLAETHLALQSAQKEVAANARREALLGGLLSLGYEVTEGMETALVQDRKLVLRSATRPDYGVEVGGDPGSGRFQMRAVAFEDGSAAADQSRDRDAETIWCSEVARLMEKLSSVGGELSIERARPVGETPLKRVSVPESAERHRSREGRAPKLRTLK